MPFFSSIAKVNSLTKTKNETLLLFYILLSLPKLKKKIQEKNMKKGDGVGVIVGRRITIVFYLHKMLSRELPGMVTPVVHLWF